MIYARDIKKGDVIRGRKFGNRKVANYVVDKVHGEDFENASISVTAHNEYSDGGPRSQRYMMISTPDAYVIRSYS